MSGERIDARGGYVPQAAVSFGSGGGLAVAVDADHPLPIANTVAAATSTPLTGASAAVGVVGPFVPQLGRPIWVTLSGSWTGSARVLRSIDGGATRLPLTVAGADWASFTGNANEPVAEESVAGASYFLELAPASGTIAYEIRQ